MRPPRKALLSVIIPCYNEADTIAEVVRRVREARLPEGWRKEIIIVDDGSGENTRAALHSLEGAARIIRREENGGKGAAVKEGVRAATGDYGIIQDADLELDPDDYAALVAPIAAGETNTVFGHRVLAETSSAPVLFLGGRLLSGFFNLAFGTRFKDIPACYKVFPRDSFEMLAACPSDDFVFDSIELTHALHRRSDTIIEVPIRYYPRTHAEGKKLRLEDGIRSAVAIVLLRIGFYRPVIAHEVPKVARFLIAGALTVLVNLAALYAFTEYAHVWYLISAVIAFAISYLVNFVLQKFWTFRHRGLNEIRYQLPLHLALALGNLVLNAVLLFLLVEWAHLWYMTAQVIVSVVIACDSFILSRKIFS